jgi:hypothetical protein
MPTRLSKDYSEDRHIEGSAVRDVGELGPIMRTQHPNKKLQIPRDLQAEARATQVRCWPISDPRRADINVRNRGVTVVQPRIGQQCFGSANPNISTDMTSRTKGWSGSVTHATDFRVWPGGDVRDCFLDRRRTHWADVCALQRSGGIGRTSFK